MCNTFNSCLHSMAFQMMGIMEADFYYYKSGAALISKLQAGTPLSFTVTADTNSGKYSTKMNFKNLVIILFGLIGKHFEKQKIIYYPHYFPPSNIV